MNVFIHIPRLFCLLHTEISLSFIDGNFNNAAIPKNLNSDVLLAQNYDWDDQKWQRKIEENK